MDNYINESADKRLDRLTGRHVAKALGQLGKAIPEVLKGSIKHSLWNLNNAVHQEILECAGTSGLDLTSQELMDTLSRLAEEAFDECATNMGSLAPPAVLLSVNRSFDFLKEDIAVQVLDLDYEEVTGSLAH